MNTDKTSTEITLAQKADAIRKMASESGRHAETAFMAIADKEGDQVAMTVLTQLNPEELGQILKDHDATVPSIAAWLAEPEKIAQLFAKSPKDWVNVKKEHILEIQEDVLSLIASVILTTNEERQEELLKAIRKVPAALFYLCLPFVGQAIRLEVEAKWYVDRIPGEITEDMAFGSVGNTSHLQTLLELLNVIQRLNPELVEEMRDFIDNQTGDVAWQDVLKTVTMLRENAITEIKQKDKDGKKQKNYGKMFTS